MKLRFSDSAIGWDGWEEEGLGTRRLFRIERGEPVFLLGPESRRASTFAKMVFVLSAHGTAWVYEGLLKPEKEET